MSQKGDRRTAKVHASASRGLPFSSAFLDASTKKIEPSEERKQESTGERRRLSRVRHDDRGNAYVEWVDAPAELVERPRLEIQGESGELQLETERSAYNPYSNASGAARKTGNTTRTDLRKLSEWIKMMREMEERKRSSGSGEDQE
jgi:hypothetical protein